MCPMWTGLLVCLTNRRHGINLKPVWKSVYFAFLCFGTSGADITSTLISMVFFIEIVSITNEWTIHKQMFLTVLRASWKEHEGELHMHHMHWKRRDVGEEEGLIEDQGEQNREKGEGVSWIELGADGLSFQSCSLFSSERLMFSDSTPDNQQGTVRCTRATCFSPVHLFDYWLKITQIRVNTLLCTDSLYVLCDNQVLINIFFFLQVFPEVVIFTRLTKQRGS